MGLAFSPEIWGLIVVASCFGGWIVGNLTAAAHAETEDGVSDGGLGGALDGYAGEAAPIGEENPLFSLRLEPVAAAKNTPDNNGIERPAQKITTQKITAQKGARAPHFSAQSELASQEVPASTFRHSTGACVHRPNSQGETEAAALDLPDTDHQYTGHQYTGHPYTGHPYTGLTAGSLLLAEIRAHARHLLKTNNVWEAPETQEQVAEFMRTADRKSIDLLSHYRGSIEELQRANDHGIRADRGHRRAQRPNPETGRQRAASASGYVRQFADTDPAYAGRSRARPARDGEKRAQVDQPRARFERPTR